MNNLFGHANGVPKETEYVLKHLDTPVIEFRIDPQDNNVDYVKILDNTFSPVNETSSEGSKIVSLNNWLINRCLPNSRDGLERLKKEYGIRDIREVVLAQFGLSLSDHYWIDKKPYDKTWKDVNLFENEYSEIIGSILFDKKIKIVKGIKIYEYRNPDTTTWIGVIPIFDNGYSLWNNDFIDPNKSSKSLSFADYNDDCLKLVDTAKYLEKIQDMLCLFEQAFENYENNERKNQLKQGIISKQTEIAKYI